VVTVAAPAQPANAVASAAVAPIEAVAAPAASAPQAAASMPPKRIAPIVVPQPEPSLVDGLLEDPLVPAGAVGLIALLAGFGVYRYRQRKKENSQVDSSFLESRLQPESFFGASGGQSVDTSDGSTSNSSLAYTPSQLDAVDDVDPVAEADVYLAYGRDLQAEEILKAALRTSPGRVAIHQKLLEIFAKRRDAAAFESTATEVFKFTGSSSPDWERVCELGLSIDPANPLYQPGGLPGSSSGTPSQLGALDFTNPAELSATPTIIEPNEPQTAGSLDLDLDLDFSLADVPASSISETTASYEPAKPSASNLEFETSTQAMGAYGMLQPELKPEAVEPSLPDLDLDMDDLPAITGDIDEFKMQAATSFGATAPAPLPSVETDDSPTTDLGMLEFDLGELSLELEDKQEAERTTEPGLIEDPLATKLALAEEFSAIGDDDGARALIEEVISEASGDMKAKAQRALSKL
jgi:pilus assembly protein FimV